MLDLHCLALELATAMSQEGKVSSQDLSQHTEVKHRRSGEGCEG